MNTLAEQITIIDSEYELSRPDIAASTYVSGMVGSGSERHAVRVTVWAPMNGLPLRTGSVRVDCGAQRAGSHVRSLSVTAPITCERCPRSVSASVQPAEILEVRDGALVVIS